MWSFLTGVAVSALLSGVMLLAMDLTTVTMPERYNAPSTLLEGVWHGDSPATMEAPVNMDSAGVD